MILINLVSEEVIMFNITIGFVSGIVFVLLIALLVAGGDD